MALPWMPRWRRRTVRAGPPCADELFVEWHGSAAVLSQVDDPPSLLWQMLRTAAAASDDVLVMTSERAVRSPACGAVLRTVVEGAAGEWGVGRVWVAANGLGRPDEAYATWLTRLAARTRVELLAPDGPVHATPDGTLYAAGGTGAWGWRSFRPGAGSPVVGNRYPVPSWERALPDHPMVVSGLVADPVPAGVLLRTSAAAPAVPGDPAFDVPVDPHGPTLVLRHIGEPPVDPRSLAGIFAGLSARTTVRIETALLDPTTPPPRVDWLDALAAALDESATASADPITVPEPGDRRRTSCQPPPLLSAGWVRIGSRLYRHANESDLLAEVVPSGVLLRTAGARRPDGMAFVDPGDWVLAVDVRASDRLVDQLCRVLVEAGGAPGLALVGQADDATTVRLEAALRAAATPPPAVRKEAGVTSAVVADISPPPSAIDESVRDAGSARLALPLSPRLSSNSASAGPSEAPVLSRRPVAAPAVAAHRRVEPAAPVAPAEGPRTDFGRPAAEDLVHDPAPPGRPPAGMPQVMTSAGPYLDEPERPAVAGVPAPRVEGPFAPQRAGPAAAHTDGSPVPRYSPAVAEPVEDRASTAEEQRDLAASLGPAFTDSITTVNAALAAWPALRQGISASAKTDFVAVHVFLGRSDERAARLNARLRAGHLPNLPGYLPCLVSGLRRLPPYRRVMLCQGRLAAQARHLYPEGGLLVEPGFRSVSGATDLAAEGADVDFLVWSRTARQAGALAERQDLDEAVFLAGARFKVLAVHEGPTSAHRAGIPATAVLLREVLPGEQPTSGLDDADRTTLTRLERTLTRRRSATPRLLTDTDTDTIGRLVGPPIGYLEDVEAPTGVAAG